MANAHKKCTNCKELKGINEFNYKIKDRDIRQSYCRDCSKAYKKEHYQANTEYYKKKARVYTSKYIKNNRIMSYEFKLGNPCVECGESDPIVLEFNHVDPTDKKYNISEMVNGGHSWKSIMNEIEKCEVLCANCHRRRTAGDFEYYSHKQIGDKK